jgi:uncharacterized membrane protein YebE (DUF533 family)
MNRLRDTPDGAANPDWIHETATRQLDPPDAGAAETFNPAVMRRSATNAALATKLLNAHLQNRLQLMQSNPTELRDLPFDKAALLLRAMIAAGHADGSLSDDERFRLVSIAERGIPDEARRQSILHEIDTPPSLEEILREVETSDMAERVYAVSAAILSSAHDINRAYLAYLAARLGLAKDIVLRTNAMTGITANGR